MEQNRKSLSGDLKLGKRVSLVINDRCRFELFRCRLRKRTRCLSAYYVPTELGPRNKAGWSAVGETILNSNLWGSALQLTGRRAEYFLFIFISIYRSLLRNQSSSADSKTMYTARSRAEAGKDGNLIGKGASGRKRSEACIQQNKITQLLQA